MLKHFREIIIYCDESDSRGDYYSNFYGGALVKSIDLAYVEKELNRVKLCLNFHGEIKWGKITENYYQKYISLMDVFFDLIKSDYIKLRIMFTQNIYTPSNLTKYQQEHEYFILYYQFLKYAFGLEYANQIMDKPINIRLYFDKLPDTYEKVRLFKAYLENLSVYKAFKKSRIIVNREQIAEVASHDHVVLQCLDVVLGAIQFRLNNKHKEKLLNRKRGKRTISKEKVYKHINKRICLIYPKFNIGCTTSRRDKLENAWLDPYRHWCFKPTDHILDLNKGKKVNKHPATAMPKGVSQVELETSQ